MMPICPCRWSFIQKYEVIQIIGRINLEITKFDTQMYNVLFLESVRMIEFASQYGGIPIAEDLPNDEKENNRLIVNFSLRFRSTEDAKKFYDNLGKRF